MEGQHTEGQRSSSVFVGYPSQISVSHGDPLIVHVAAHGSQPECWVDVYHIVGCDELGEPKLDFVARAGPVTTTRYATGSNDYRVGPGNADVDGCGWAPACALDRVPAEWKSGMYLLQFTAANEPTGQVSDRLGQDAIVILRRPANDPASSILVQVGVATWNAYHIWQNRCLYIGDVGDPSGEQASHLRSHKASFHRPGIGLAPRLNCKVFPPLAYAYLPPFIEWARQEGFLLDYCAGTDIDQQLVNLESYQLLVTLGHDEYWSRGQRDAVESYIARGGNAAFLGGNLAYWQIRLSTDGTAIECYKRAPDPKNTATFASRSDPLDPLYRDAGLYPGHDNSDVTVEYHTPPLNRSPVSMMGTSMRNDDASGVVGPDGPVSCGAAWWWENFGGPERPRKGFTVVDEGHWVFAETGLESGSTFGEEQKLIGFECDGLDVEFIDGVPRPTFRDGAPKHVTILAYADCSDWAETDYSTDAPVRTPGARASRGGVGGVVTMVTLESPGGGSVFTAPSTDWPRALVDLDDYTARAVGAPRIAHASPQVRAITSNVLRRLGDLRSDDLDAASHRLSR